jgi:hypothetical protein
LLNAKIELRIQNIERFRKQWKEFADSLHPLIERDVFSDPRIVTRASITPEEESRFRDRCSYLLGEYQKIIPDVNAYGGNLTKIDPLLGIKHNEYDPILHFLSSLPSLYDLAGALQKDAKFDLKFGLSRLDMTLGQIKEMYEKIQNESAFVYFSKKVLLFIFWPITKLPLLLWSEFKTLSVPHLVFLFLLIILLLGFIKLNDVLSIIMTIFKR